MSFTPTRLGNPCIHCNDIKGNCRTHKTREMQLCVSLASSVKGEKSQGYVVIGDTDDGRWAQLLPDNGTEYSSEKIRELQIEWRQQEEQAKRERLAGEMPAIERDKYYRDILAQLGLCKEDKADLVRRGFTEEQIAKAGFRTVERWQKLDKTYPRNLPGINSQGNGLITHTPGYVCPITDADGLIVGLQVRKRVLLNNDNQRYYFLSQDSSIRLNDQVPLAVFSPSEQKLNKVALVEGVGVKPYLTCERLGVPVIGAAGANWASSEVHLAKALSQVDKQTEVVLIPDAGSVANKSVVHQYRRATNLLQSWGYKVTFAWWSQVNKTFGDIDELAPEKYSTIQYLSVAEFKGLCIKWGGLEEKPESNLVPLDYQERVAVAQKKLHSLSYSVDLVCDASKKYLPDLVGRIPLKGVLILKSPKGSGKSHQIKKIKQYCCGQWVEKITYPEVQALEVQPEQLSLLGDNKVSLPVQEALPEPVIERVFDKGLGMKFVSINARIALGREQAIRWEFCYIEDADIEEGKEEFGVKLSTETIIENISEIGLCVDSLAKLKHRDWSNTVIVIDEIELVLNHVATSSTCRDKRSQILQIIQDKIKEALDNGGLLIGADADVTNVTIDYLKAIAPNHIPFIVGHDFKGDPWEISFTADKRDQILSQIEQHLADPNCEPIAVAIDNQKECEALDLILKRKYPYLNNIVGGLIRIDSRITQQDFGKDFVKQPNENILKYLPKILLYTPSLGVGCSIDVHYFKHVYGFFFGNLEPSQARQMLARVRESVPRTVWAKVRAGNVENEATSYLPEDIKKRMFGKNETAMTVCEIALTKALEDIKASGINNPEDKDVLPVLIETLKAMQAPDGSWNNPHIDLWCNQTARRNYSLSQFAVQLRQELLDEGHIILDIDCEQSTDTGESVKDAKEELRRRDSALTANAEDIPFKDAQELKRKAARTQEEEYKITKAFLKHDLPEVELTEDFIYKAVHADNGQWLSQAKLFWHLQNSDALAHKDDRHWRQKLQQFSLGVVCLWDVKLDAPKVEAIVKSGLLDWIKLDDLEAEYSSNSEGGQLFLKNCLTHKKMLKNVFGITVKPESYPIAVADKLLSKLGLALDYSKKNDGIKYYKLDEELANDSDRKAVFEALNLKWQNEKAKMAEMTAQHQKTNGTNENNFLYKNSSSSREIKPEENHPYTEHNDNSNNTDSQNNETGAGEVFQWRGCQFKLMPNLTLDNRFLQEQYDDLTKWVHSLPSDLLTADCEPTYNAYNGTWSVWVGSVGALKSVRCDWLAFVGYPLEATA